MAHVSAKRPDAALSGQPIASDRAKLALSQADQPAAQFQLPSSTAPKQIGALLVRPCCCQGLEGRHKADAVCHQVSPLTEESVRSLISPKAHRPVSGGASDRRRRGEVVAEVAETETGVSTIPTGPGSSDDE